MTTDATFRTVDRLCRELEDGLERRSIKTASATIQKRIRKALEQLEHARDMAQWETGQ